MNFMGLGFSFAAQDKGLEAALLGIDKQFEHLNNTLKGFQETASVDAAPAADFVQGIQDQLADVQGIDLEDVVQTGGAAEGVEKEVGGVGDAIGGMAADAAEGATGFGRMANSIMGGAGKITGAFGFIGMAFGPVLTGFGEVTEAAGGMVDAFTGMPSRVGRTIHNLANEGINLTNSLEAEAVSLGQTARSTGVNMGYVGQDLRRFIGQATGMAMGLNIGAEEAARSIRAWDEAAGDLAATGLSSARDVARFTSALGVNADILRNSTMEMRNLGASDEEIHRITSSITAMGQATGDVAGALNELPQIMQMLERRRALGDSPEQMAAFAADTAAAARGLFALTEDSDRARDMASQLAGTVTESREAFQNMFAGTEAELPQLVTELSITGGEVNRAFELMQEGPGGLIEGMGQLVQGARESGGDVGHLMEFMRGRLQQVFGPEMTATLVNFWGTMDNETVQAMGAIRNASVDLGDLGRQAHTTGRTLDEVFERMRAGFQTSFRRVARDAVRDFVKDTGQTLRQLRTRMNEAADGGGALASVMEQLSLSSQIGALALVPEELRSTTIAADELQGMVTPLIQSFSSFEGILETVGAYVALFATEVMLAKDEGETWAQAIDEVANKFSRIFIEVIDDAERFVMQVVDTFSTFNWDDLFGAEGEDGASTAFGRVFERLGDVKWGEIWDKLRTGFEALFERIRPWLVEKLDQFKTVVSNKIAEWWGDINWEEVFSELREIAGLIWFAFRPALSELGEMITDWLSDHWGDILLATAAALTAGLALLLAGAAVAVIGLLAASAAAVVGVVLAPWFIFGAELAAYWDELAQYFTTLWDDTLGPYVDKFDETLLEVDAAFRRTWNTTTNWFKSLWDRVASWFGNLWDRLTSTVEQAVQDWQSIFSTLGDFFGDLWNTIIESAANAVSWLGEVFEPFFDTLTGAWESVREVATGMWDSIADAASGIWEGMLSVPEQLESAWESITGVLSPIFQSIEEALQPLLASFDRVAEAGTGALGQIIGSASEYFGNSINTIVGEDMAATEEVMNQAAHNVSQTMEQVLYGTTVRAITEGFAQGFAHVTENMGDFSTDMTDAFTELADGILEIMTGMFEAVITNAEITMLAAETAVEGIIGRLRTITAAQAQLAQARGEAVSSLARPADAEAVRRRMAQLESSPVLQAIHRPDWYGGVGAGRGGYQQLFTAKMDELIRTIAAMGVAETSNTLEERRRLIREAGERLVGRPRTRGHNSLPTGVR